MFDKVYCLSVDKRISERPALTERFAKHGLEVEFFTAGGGKLLPAEAYDHIDVTTPEPGLPYPWAQPGRINSYNAFLSFQKMLARCRAKDLDHVLILEDDAMPTSEFDEVLAIARQQLPVRWDLFYLGSNHTWAQTEEVDSNLLRLRGGSQCWHAVAVRHTLFEALIEARPVAPIDDVCARFVQTKTRYACYAAWPSIVLQQPGLSSCEGRYQDYRHYFASKGNVAPKVKF